MSTEENVEKSNNIMVYYKLTHVFLIMDLILIIFLIIYKDIFDFKHVATSVFYLFYYAGILFFGPIIQYIELKKYENTFARNEDKIIIKLFFRVFITIMMLIGSLFVV